ncbi:MAG: hypothetical protein ACRCS8_03795 [Brevinema sp.]
MKKIIYILLLSLPTLSFAQSKKPYQIQRSKTFKAYTLSTNYIINLPFNVLPDIGFDKNEIKTITILRKKYIKTVNNTNIFAPVMWLFEGNTWKTNYEGVISNFETLADLNEVGLSILSHQEKIQSEEGFQLDSSDQSFGIYNMIHFSDSNDIIKFEAIEEPGEDF